MKRLLFSHKSDVDGMGEVILSLIAFGSIDYILCKNVKELEEVFLEAYANNTFDQYDIIYITDLSLTRGTIEKIMNDEKVKNDICWIIKRQYNSELGLLINEEDNSSFANIM